MKKLIPILLGVFLSLQLTAQDFTGQWRGQFTDKSTSFIGWGGDRCDYVLEIECKGNKITGYSYTYFSDGGKRYYTICKLKGTIDKASKSIEVIEIERTKTNVPVNIRNCFQIHKLTYFKQEDEQKLEGSWIPAPNQQGDCGFGSTILSRRVLLKNPLYFTDPSSKVNKPKSVAPVVKTPKQQKPQPIAGNKPKQVTPSVIKKQPAYNTVPSNQSPDLTKSKTIDSDMAHSPSVKNEPVEKSPQGPKFEKRNNDLLNTIEIENETFTVDLYDNGEIDGDSISLFFNGKLLLSHRRLGDKAINLKLNIDESRDVNELIMYAENLGSIPPNTALMVVHDGDKRYETRISSDLQKSGAIRFIHKPKKGQ